MHWYQYNGPERLGVRSLICWSATALREGRAARRRKIHVRLTSASLPDFLAKQA